MDIQINTVTLPDGTTAIEINDGSKPDGHIEEIGDFKIETAEVEQRLIDECERLAEETGKIHFLFDTETSLKIKRLTAYDKEDKREILLSELFDDDIYEVVDENGFREMPSRFSYYDTETKLTCRYKKHSYAIDWFRKIGFIPSEHNYGAEYENSFTLDLENGEKLIIRLQPNLSVKLIHAEEYHMVIYAGFFSKLNILNAIEKRIPDFKSIVRDAKLDIVFDEKKESL
jgi:hypothetical protein